MFLLVRGFFYGLINSFPFLFSFLSVFFSVLEEWMDEWLGSQSIIYICVYTYIHTHANRTNDDRSSVDEGIYTVQVHIHWVNILSR